MTTDTIARRHDVDWLRVGATYLLFVFHVAKVFDPAPFYHVRNDELSMGMLILSGFISLWHMPLFFVLAGWSILGSLRVRGPAGFLRERVLRLLVPLIAGSAIFGPPIKYLELSSGLDASAGGLAVSRDMQAGISQVIPQGLPEAPPFTESFLEFFPTFYTVLDRFTWAHLWFIAYLFTFSLLYAPLLFRLARRPISGERGGVGAAWVYAPLVALVPIQVFLRPHWPGLQNLYDDWANFAMYTTYLFVGFLIARSPALERAVHAEWRRAFAISLAAMVVLVAGVAGVVTSGSVILAATAVAGWCFIVGLLGFARLRLSFETRALPYLVESALPVYILHQAAIVIPGYWIVKLPLGIAAKFALLLVVSVALTMAVYEIVVRRFALTRFLFGMRPLPARRRVWTPAPRAAAVVALAVAGSLGAAGALGLPAAFEVTGAHGAERLRPAPDADARSALGVWLVEGGAATVEISSCGEGLCGRVAWLRSPLDDQGCSLRDQNNPDPTLRGRPVLGLDVLHGLAPEGDDAWGGGTIYDPSSGSTYRCTAQLEGPDRLRLRGYVGIPILGRTTTWIRLGTEERMCAESRTEAS